MRNIIVSHKRYEHHEYTLCTIMLNDGENISVLWEDQDVVDSHMATPTHACIFKAIMKVRGEYFNVFITISKSFIAVESYSGFEGNFIVDHGKKYDEIRREWVKYLSSCLLEYDKRKIDIHHLPAIKFNI